MKKCTDFEILVMAWLNFEILVAFIRFSHYIIMRSQLSFRYNHPLVSTGDWFQDLCGYQNLQMFQVPYIKQCSICIYDLQTSSHYFKSSLDYLKYQIQCKCYVIINNYYTILFRE